MNLNKAIIIGRVTANPELRKTGQGNSVTTFGVATNRVWNDASGAKKEETEFHNVVAWGRTAEIASQFLMKGSLVLIEGRLQTRSWQDKQGANHKTTEIICERLQLGPRPMGSGGGADIGRSAPQRERPRFQEPSHDDIPVIDMDAEEIKIDEVPF